LKLIHSTPSKGEIRFSQANIALARKELGFSPKISLKQGIEDLMKSS